MYKGSSNFGLLRFYYMRCKTYGDEHRETMLIKVDFYANFLKFYIQLSQHQQNQTCCGALARSAFKFQRVKGVK